MPGPPKKPPATATPDADSKQPSASMLLWLAGFVYGIASICYYTIVGMINDGSVFLSLTPKAREASTKAREKLWSLKLSEFDHRFILSNGIKMHYVVVSQAKKATNPNLTIFIHGFPDSWAVWSHQLASQALREDSILIALDLPGYGGSADLPKYGPDEVLETVAQFIVQMRDIYVDTDDNTERGRVVIVSHDWGTTIAYRLAAEAPQLADRFIVTNSMHAALIKSNYQSHVAGAKRILHNWKRQPLGMKLRLLKKALINISPLVTQVRRSSYIFSLNLPMAIVRMLGPPGEFSIYRMMHAQGASQTQAADDPLSTTMFASSMGPSLEHCQTSLSKKPEAGVDSACEQCYDPSVAQRASVCGWTSKVQLYRDGLSSRRWTKSLQLLAALQSLEDRIPPPQQKKHRRRPSMTNPIFDTAPKGALKVPTTVVWGMKDPALDYRMCVEGISDYMVRDSQVFQIKDVSHWVPTDPRGIAVIEKLITWSVHGEEENIGDLLNGLDYAKLALEK